MKSYYTTYNMIGTIYKITNHNKIYIGSTTDLRKRMYKHKAKFNMWKKDDTKQFYSSFIIFNENDDWKMEEIISLEVIDENELRQMEGVFIEAYKNDGCVNRTIAGRTKQGWAEDNRDKRSKSCLEYYYRNRDAIKLKYKEKRKRIAEENTKTL